MSVPQRDAPYTDPMEWVERAQERYGELSHIEGIFGPRATPMRISAPTIVMEAQSVHGHHVITVNPYTSEPLTSFIAEETLAMLPFKLHLFLFAQERYSQAVTTAVAIAIIAFMVTGLYIWWPGARRFTAAAKPKKPTSPITLRQFHSAVGFWSAPLILVSAITGFVLINPDLGSTLVSPLGQADTFDPNTSARSSCRPDPGEQPTNIRLEDSKGFLDKARSLYPNYEMATFTPANTGFPYTTMSLRPKDGLTPVRGDTFLAFDALCRTLVYEFSDKTALPGDYVMTFLLDVHNGTLLGLFGEGLVVLTGLLLGVLPIAGLTLWVWKRRRQRSARRS